MTTEAAKCPVCGAPQVQAVAVQRKSLSRALLAELAFGTAAGVAAGSDQVIMAVCLACGQQWVPGELGERQARLRAGLLSKEEGVALIRDQVAAGQAEHERRMADARAQGKEWAILIGGCLGVLVLLGLIAQVLGV